MFLFYEQQHIWLPPDEQPTEGKHKMSGEPDDTEMIQLTANYTTPQVPAKKQITAAIPAEEMGNQCAIKILSAFISSHACKLKVWSVLL